MDAYEGAVTVRLRADGEIEATRYGQGAVMQASGRRGTKGCVHITRKLSVCY